MIPLHSHLHPANNRAVSWVIRRRKPLLATSLLASLVFSGLSFYKQGGDAGLRETHGAFAKRVWRNSERQFQPTQIGSSQLRSVARASGNHPLVLHDSQVEPCQALGPAAPYAITSIDGTATEGCGELDWSALGSEAFQLYAQGEYVGRARLPHVHEYRLRVDDNLEFIYRITREETTKPYELNVGDIIRIESLTDPKLDSEQEIQPDGTIALRLIDKPIRATRRTVLQLREELSRQYAKYYKSLDLTVIPVKVNAKLEDLRQTVDSRFGRGGQIQTARVTPEGTVALPVVNTVYVQGLTLDELKNELDARYSAQIEGIEIIPRLTSRAPRYVFVVGEVLTPGRYTLEGPTTVMQAIALAGSWNNGANLRNIVVFRRGDDWRLLATQLDLQGALYGRRPTPADEIWLGDSDLIVVPKSPIKVADDVIDLVFTRGIYGVMPFNTNYSFNGFNTLP